MKDLFGDAAREKLGLKGGHVPTGRPGPGATPDPAPADEHTAADSATPPPAETPGPGFGGGQQGITVPAGENLGDAVRRAVFGS